jgi:hypothetical protein
MCPPAQALGKDARADDLFYLLASFSLWTVRAASQSQRSRDLAQLVVIILISGLLIFSASGPFFAFQADPVVH